MLSTMKSAYELAMERLKEGDSDNRKPLSPEQKESLANLDRTYAARIAEREIFLQKQLEEALAKGEHTEAEQIRKQRVNERARLEEERDDKKERIRRESA